MTKLTDFSTFDIGDKLALRDAFDAFNIDSFPAGAAGIVIAFDEINGDDCVALKMDETFDGLRDWNNVLYVFRPDGPAETTIDLFEVVFMATQIRPPLIETLARAARPIDDDDWGTDRQIEAENAFFEAAGDLGPDFEAFSNKATSNEMIDEALRILRARRTADEQQGNT